MYACIGGKPAKCGGKIDKLTSGFYKGLAGKLTCGGDVCIKICDVL